jgi:hypothetical protein
MSDLTQVEIVWLKQRIENYIRFGNIAGKRIVDRNRRVVSFAPGSMFAFVRWTANDYGTIASRLDILRAVRPGERCSTVAHVRPGAEILLTATGWPRVEQALKIVDAIEALGIDPTEVSPDYWRHAHSRFAAREALRPYTRQRHRAWMLRRAVEP